jgi:hypothetical protein
LMSRHKGFHHEWHGKRMKQKDNAFLKELSRREYLTMDDFLLRQFREIPMDEGEPSDLNMLAYTLKFDRIFLRTVKWAKANTKSSREPTRNEVFVMVKNLGREPQGRSPQRLGKGLKSAGKQPRGGFRELR